MSASNAQPRVPWHASYRLRVALLAALVVLAYALPRAVALRGLRGTAIVEFADMADHLYFLDLVQKRGSLSAAQVQDPFFAAFPETQPRSLAIQWPPGIYHVTALWARALGPGHIWTTQLTNLLFSLLIILGVAGLGRSLSPGREGVCTGLWAALLCVLSPPLVASTWYYSLDYPLVGMTTFGLWLLWLTGNFRRTAPTLAFGVWSALGSVIKPTYALYLVGPAVALLVLGLRTGPGARPRLQVAARVLAGLGAALGLTLWLYQPDWQAIGVETRVHFVDRTLPGATTDPWTLEWFVANVKFAIANYPWPLLIPVIPGIALLHWPRRAVPGRWLHLALLYSTYVFLTLLANKMERYIQPVYPVFCLLTVFWIRALLPRVARAPVLGLLAAGYAAMLGTTHLERPLPWLPEPREAIPMPSAYHPFRYEFHTPTAAQLERLRRLRWDTRCDFRGVVAQVDRWLTAEAAGDRPVGMAYVRDLSRSSVGHPPMPFRKLIPAVTQTVRDRFIMVGNLHLLPGLPPPLLHIPTVIVLHGPEIDLGALHPELRVQARTVVSVTCGAERYPFHLTLATPRKPL